MPVKFKIIPSSSSDPLGEMQEKVQTALGLPKSATVAVGMSRTTISYLGIELALPVGAAFIKNGKSFDHQKTLLAELVNASSLYAALETTQHDMPAPSQPDKPYDDMIDEEWVNAVAEELFPGILHLHQATQMHQPVLGTSSGSIYRTCFVGPELKVAARLKKSSVSFRVTTNMNTSPQGDVKAVFERLGVTSDYGDRLTVHASMSGPYTPETAPEYRALFGAYYAALRPWLTSGFPSIGKLAEGVK